MANPLAALADTSTPAAYKQAVQDALTLARGPLANNADKARLVVNRLQDGAGLTQPEIVADLERNPPDFADAIARLQALSDALDSPAQAADPVLARQRLNGVLAMYRYDNLHRPASWLDRLRQWVGDRINDLLNAFRRQAGSSPLPLPVFYLLGAAIIAIVAVVLFSSARGRLDGGAAAWRSDGARAPADYFAEADQLAAAGDRVGAIRALCAGVAATLTGERTWEGSPLTVREIFQHAPEPSSLRPLLAPFEAAIYGGREVDESTYARALQVAAPFRQPSELAA